MSSTTDRKCMSHVVVIGMVKPAKERSIFIANTSTKTQESQCGPLHDGHFCEKVGRTVNLNYQLM